MIDICFSSNQQAKAAEAPPAPEATPESVIAPEDTTGKASERKQTKAKGTGLSNYTNDLNTDGGGSGLNVPV